MASAPTITGTYTPQAVASGSTIKPFSAVTISDPTANATDTVSIALVTSLGSLVNTISDDNGTLAGPGLTHSGNGTYTLAASDPATLTAELDQAVFTPITLPNGAAPLSTTIQVTAYNVNSGASGGHYSATVGETAPSPPGVNALDTTTGQSVPAALQPYTGPVGFLQWQYAWSGADGVNVTASLPNVFLKGGPGNDALQAQAGINVLDGGTGSNFLVGASGADGGADTFFTDARGAGVTWDTLVNFHKGDAATLWGFVPGTSTWHWDGISGAGSYQGATLRADVHGTGTTDASITFAGLTMAQAQGLQITTGTAGGSAYLYLRNPGV